MPKKTPVKQTSLFEIRLKNHDHDVLVLKGSPHDAASALLTGKIVLSVNEPFTIKKISLRLYATLRLNFTENIQTTKGSFPKTVRHERKLYEYNWDNMEINKYLTNMYENSSHPSNGLSSGSSNRPEPGNLSKTNSSSSLKNLGGHFRSKSSSNLSSLKLSSNSSSSSNLAGLSSSSLVLKGGNHVLVKGNYEIPFSAIMPGNIPESIEGLPGASVVYKLEASIDRGKFHNPMIAKKHLRVVRTLTTDAVELSETVAVDNTWPKKVEYSLTVPSRAIAIGSGTPITLMLVPLLKGLKLGETKITLVEYYSYMGYAPPVKNGERIISSKTLPAPKEDDPDFQLDRWEVQTFIRAPPTLAQCTQDCDVLTNVKVRHKIKFAIGLVNPDGHVSELRASLPVTLFISPFVTVRASNEDDTQSDTSEPHEELLFTGDRSASHTSLSNAGDNTLTATNLQSNSSSYSSFSGLVAPPLYEQHIYDRLWSDVSPVESPIGSGSATPREAQQPSDVQDHFSMSPIDSVQLNENLRLLSIQRQAQENSASNTPSAVSTPGRATFSLDGELGDYFSQRRPNLSNQNSSGNFGLTSPGAMSPAMFLSRTQSEAKLDSHTLSRVPSYHEAIRGNDDESEPLSPAYEPPLPGSHINLAELNRRNKSSSPRNGSLNSSPAGSRNVSSSNLSALNNLRMSPAPPLQKADSETAAIQTAASVAKPSSSASDRNAALLGGAPRSSSSLNLHNIHFLNKKKSN